MIWLIFGPSGVGKSSFGKWLADEQKWLHLEIDLFPNGDGIDHHGLRREWDEFLSGRGDALPLRRTIDKRRENVEKVNCALTFPGGLVLDPRHIAAADSAGMNTIILHGSEAECRKSFLERERRTGRNLPLSHWEANRGDLFAKLREPRYRRVTIRVFTRSGERKPHAEVFKAALRNNRRPT